MNQDTKNDIVQQYDEHKRGEIRLKLDIFCELAELFVDCDLMTTRDDDLLFREVIRRYINRECLRAKELIAGGQKGEETLLCERFIQEHYAMIQPCHR